MTQNRLDINFEIILALLKGPDHGRAIAKKIGHPQTSVQRALIRLEGSGVLESRIIGKNKAYSIKKGAIAKRHVYNAENYKFLGLVNQYPHLSPVIEDVTTRCKAPMILLFGSFAKFQAKKDSDIDIFIETTDRSLKKELEQLNSRLSIKIGNFDTSSLLIKEIIKNHVIVRGVEQYYEKTGFFKMG